MLTTDRDDTHRQARKTNCRLCSGSDVQDFFLIENSPSSVEGLLSAAELETDRIISLNVVKCNDCGFIQLPFSPLQPDFYRKYDKSAVHSKKMRSYQHELSRELNSKIGLTGKLVLEPGCGDGHFSELLTEFGSHVQAIEPGAKAAEMARSRNLAVIEDYFTTNLPLAEEEFDIIVLRQVLSHIEDLHAFMSATDKFLKPGGLIVAEVTNVDKAIAQRHYFDFFGDYVNYFSPRSLNSLMKSQNFEMQECSSRMDGDYTLGIFRKPIPVDFMADFDSFSDALRGIVRDERSKGCRVACWGAGGRGVSLLLMCGFEQTDIAYVVDSSPEKQGLFTPGSKFQIVAPSTLLTDPVDNIMITAILFQEEILNSLKNEYGFSGQAILITPQPKIVKV